MFSTELITLPQTYNSSSPDLSQSHHHSTQVPKPETWEAFFNSYLYPWFPSLSTASVAFISGISLHCHIPVQITTTIFLDQKNSLSWSLCLHSILPEAIVHLQPRWDLWAVQRTAYRPVLFADFYPLCVVSKAIESRHLETFVTILQ